MPRYRRQSPLVRGFAACLLLSLCAGASSAQAQTDAHAPTNALPEDATLTLAQAAQAAYQRDPQFGVLRQRLQEVDARQREAHSLIAGAPEIAARLETDRYGRDTGVREYEVYLSAPLWHRGQRAARGAWVQALGQSVNDAQTGRQLEVAARLREAIWDAALKANEADLAQRAWDTARTLAKDIDKRVALGELPRSDALKARAESLRLNTELLSAQAEFKHTLHRYENLTGLTRLPLQRRETQSPLQTIAQDHPLLAQARSQVEAARKAVAVARHERVANPRLQLNARQQQAVHTETPTDSLGMQFTLALGIGSHGASMLGAANTALEQAQADLLSTRRRLEARLEETAHELAVARASLDLASQRRALAEEDLRMGTIAFETGEIDLTRLLMTQSTTFNARRAEQNLRINTWLAVALYNQAAGVLP